MWRVFHNCLQHAKAQIQLYKIWKMKADWPINELFHNHIQLGCCSLQNIPAFNRLWLNLHLRSHCQKSRWHPSLPSPAPLNTVSCPSPLGKCQSWWGHLRGDNDKKHGCHYNDSDFKCTLCVSRMITSKNSLHYKVKKLNFWLLADNIQQCFSRKFVGRENTVLGKGMCPQNTLMYINLCLNSVEHFSVFKESCLWCVGSWEHWYYHGCRVIYVAAQVSPTFHSLNVTGVIQVSTEQRQRLARRPLAGPRSLILPPSYLTFFAVLSFS